MKKNIKMFLLAIGAGLAISIGGTVYLSVDNKIIGSLLFAVGLYAIVLNGLFLYTGKVGYLVDQSDKIEYLGLLAITWLGNLAGTWIGAVAVLNTRIQGIRENAVGICETKLADGPLSIFLLAIFCGILMYIAVDGFKEKENPLILFICVSVFILSGFEHCIANMFYFSIAGAWSLKTIVYLIIMTLGNSLGGVLIPSLKKWK
ncbi:formate/nitrite transporter family protein [Blautia obeum]|uniref:formate/nitrite transporter family protein n=1 Tax=Blautia obeum TaxID=40520 RepID=UPI002A86224C|nr:formate/nitrite transporter family protein [Lachnospiraceae bacterium]MCI6535518.1 formate/nitrite transporter family protein [Lachnospiraceae bacterium]MDY4207659.1 formate/nitrite transporter family protein [Lachnospiraceae bacterium]